MVFAAPTMPDVGTGLIAAIVTLAGWLALGLLAYVPIGAAAAETGIPAACTTVSLGALIVAALGRSRLPTGGLSSATTLIYATAVAALAADPLLRLEQPGALRTLVAAASFCVLMMGLLQAMFGELLVFAAGNMACGIFGGLPLVTWRARARALTRNGAASRWAAAACAVITGLLLFTGGRLIALLPLTVLAGLMVTVAWHVSDGWTRRLLARRTSSARSRDRRLNLALVAVVFGLTLWQGVVAGVAVGILLAMALLVHALNRSLIRARYSAAEQPSRRIYPALQEAVLHDARRQIVVIEIEGALFFGNAERLALALEELAGARFVVLDLKRISTIDASGATLLAQIASRLAREDRCLMLAGVSADNRHGQALRAFIASDTVDRPGAGAPGDAWFADSDQAIEAAERTLLAQAGMAIDSAEFALDDCSLLQGLDPQQRARLHALLKPRQVAAQEVLFRQGDAGDCIYVLTRGSITVSSASEAGHHLRRRYLSLSPGMMLGETAMLDGGGRTADAVADAPSVVHTLSRDALEQLRREDPVLAGQLMANIALHLSERLRHAALAWRAMAA